MSIRPARTTDVFDLAAILCEHHPRSRYAQSTRIDEPYTRKLLAQAIQRNGGKHDGSTCALVSVNSDNQIEAFIVGVLDRIYHIMTDLRAQDMFLVAAAGASPIATRRLINGYLDWAQSNPAVHEIYLSHTDVLPEGERMSRLYERIGFTRCGAIYRRETGNSKSRSAQ